MPPGRINQGIPTSICDLPLKAVRGKIFLAAGLRNSGWLAARSLLRAPGDPEHRFRLDPDSTARTQAQASRSARVMDYQMGAATRS